MTSETAKKIKNSLRINGTTFNKVGVAKLSKEEFIKMHENVEEVKMNASQLSDAYDILTNKKTSLAEK